MKLSAADVVPTIGDDDYIYVDVQALGEDDGKTLAEVFGRPNARATEMPTQTWDWSNGSYSGSFEIAYEYSYTQYNFTGYSEINVAVCASRDRYTPASDNYTVYLMTGTGQGTIASSISFNSTDWKGVRFYNMDPGTKYAICFAKANDGSVLSGSFNIYQTTN